MQFLSFLALAAPLVAAIEFTSPAANSSLVEGATYDLTWSSVDTDPETFSVFLVNFVNWPPFYTEIAGDIDTSLGEYSVQIPCDVDASYGFQFNAINGTNVYVIYAQTPKFTIAASNASCVDATTPVSTCAATTVTTTLLVTQTPSVSNGTTVFTSAPQSTQYVARGASASCPETIGWGAAGYISPVTLSSVPHPSTIATPTTTPKVSCGHKKRNHKRNVKH